MDEQQRQTTEQPFSFNVGSLAQLVSNVGLSTVIVVVLLWFIVPPCADMVRAAAAAIPVHAQAAKESAEAQKVAAMALEQNAKGLNRVAEAVENQTVITREVLGVLKNRP